MVNNDAAVPYEYRGIDMKSFNHPAGLTKITINNLCVGLLPTRIIVGFVQSAAFRGDYKKNPYNFEHFHLDTMSIYNGSTVLPTTPIKTVFGSNRFSTAFDYYFVEQMGLTREKTNGLTRDDFLGGYALYAFNLTPDLSSTADSETLSTLDKGIIWFEASFEKKLDNETTSVFFFEYEQKVEIDQFTNVHFDDFTPLLRS